MPLGGPSSPAGTTTHSRPLCSTHVWVCVRRLHARCCSPTTSGKHPSSELAQWATHHAWTCWLGRQSPRHKTAAMHRQVLHTRPLDMQTTQPTHMGPLMCSLSVDA